jgi:hypothetical protein
VQRALKGEQDYLWKDILKEELESDGDNQQNGTSE